MAHGWTLDHRSWLPVAQRLLREAPEARVVLWDQRGHGDSTFAQGRRRVGSQTVRSLGDDLAAVIATVPDSSPLVLAGHSMGGMTVMAFAGLHPEVVRSRVRGAVLVATAYGDLRGRKIPGEGAVMKAASRLPLRLGPLVRPHTQSRTSFGPKARLEDITAVAAQIGSTRLATTGVFYAALMAHDERESLPVLDEVGTTIVAGSKDRLTPLRLNKALADALPHSDLRVIEGRGHMLTYEASDAVADAIRERLNQ